MITGIGALLLIIIGAALALYHFMDGLRLSSVQPIINQYLMDQYRWALRANAFWFAVGIAFLLAGIRLMFAGE